MWLGDSFGAGPISEVNARIDFIESWYKVLKEY